MTRWMTGLITGATFALLTPALSAAAPATVLNFEDLGSDVFLAERPSYGGLDWSAGDWFAFNEVQDPYNAHSGSYRLASGFGDADATTAIGLGANTTFQGAWFAGLEGATVTFELFYRGTQVGTSATLDPGPTPQFLASGYAGRVDRVIVASPGQGSYVMDDFGFTPAVPEPSTWALTFAGLGALGVVALRRKVGR